MPISASAVIKGATAASATVAKTVTVGGVAKGAKVVTASGELAISENGTYNVAEYASVAVNVPIPSNYGRIEWNGSILTVS